MEAVVGGRICSWEHLSYTDSSELLQLSTANQTIANKLEEIFTLNTNSEEKIESKRAHITRDLFYHVVMFARRNNFKEEQLSALITIMKSVHELCISTPYDNSRDCYELMKQLLMCHSVHRPPYSIQLYSLDQVKTVMEYILQAYFKHFKLYKYAFTKRVLLDLKISYEGVEDTPPSSHTNLLTECEADHDVREGNDDNGAVATTVSSDQLQEEDDSQPPSLTPEQQKLQEMISQAMAGHMKKLKLTVDKELADSNSRLSEKMEAMEAVFTVPKEKKGK